MKYILILLCLISNSCNSQVGKRRDMESNADKLKAEKLFSYPISQQGTYYSPSNTPPDTVVIKEIAQCFCLIPKYRITVYSKAKDTTFGFWAVKYWDFESYLVLDINNQLKRPIYKKLKRGTVLYMKEGFVWANKTILKITEQ